MAQHAANGRYAVRNKQREVPIEFARIRGRNMRMHFRQPGHQVTVRAIDRERISRNGHIVHIADGRDNAAIDQHGLRWQHRIGSHRQNVDVDKCGRVCSHVRRRQKTRP